MLRGLYTAAAGMITQQRIHDTITNNISNINTPGYKQDNAVSRAFPEFLISAMSSNGSKTAVPIGRLHNGVFAEEDPSIYVQGDLEETKNPFDFALVSNIQTDANGQPLPLFDASGKAVDADGNTIFQPQAFFTLQNDAGERRYTRNGRFTVTDTGELRTPEGYKVLGSDGNPIILRDAAGTGVARVAVGEDGSLRNADNGQALVNGAGQPIRLLVSRAENPNRLVREGNGVYLVQPEDQATVTDMPTGGEVQVRQGYIERSNVDPTQSAIDLMSALRAYEANQKMVQYYDKSLEKAVNEVGRV